MNPPKKRKLTARQDKFIDKYIETGNATEAARQANYAPKNPDVTAAQNLAKPSIIEELKRRKDLAAEKAGVSLDWKFKMLKHAAELCLLPTEGQHGITSHVDAKGLVSSIAETNKMQGHYEADKHEEHVTVDNNALQELVDGIKKEF